MLFWITLSVFVVSFVLLAIFKDYCVGIREVLGFVFGAIAFVSSIVAVVMAIIIMINHFGISGQVESMNAEYDSLMYQYESNLYDNDNDLGKKELMNDIQTWNKDVARGKKNQRDFWVGVFTPNIYDQFELIEYKEIVVDEP